MKPPYEPILFVYVKPGKYIRCQGETNQFEIGSACLTQLAEYALNDLSSRTALCQRQERVQTIQAGTENILRRDLA